MTASSSFLPPSPPSLQDYVRFHGMLCSPSAARRCIDSFRPPHHRSGVILFLPYDCPNQDALESYYHCRFLSVLSYYCLVLVSFTGFSTWYGLTKTLTALEYHGAKEEKEIVTTRVLAANHDKLLRVEPFVWNYILHETSSFGLKLVRQFEFEFLMGMLSVIMLHVRSDNQQLHLIEVYRFQSPALRFLSRIILRPASVLGNLLFGRSGKSHDFYYVDEEWDTRRAT